MQEEHLFEYAVIRIVPKVEREEFLNVGVVLYCARKKFLKAMFELDEARLNAFSGSLDIAELREYLCAFERISAGGNDAGPIGKLPAGERFRWLTATRSTVVQTSKVHPGLCNGEPGIMLDKLYSQLVLRNDD
jgi:hypothetical protein